MIPEPLPDPNFGYFCTEKQETLGEKPDFFDTRPEPEKQYPNPTFATRLHHYASVHFCYQLFHEKMFPKVLPKIGLTRLDLSDFCITRRGREQKNEGKCYTFTFFTFIQNYTVKFDF